MTVFNKDIPQFNRHTRSPSLTQMWETDDKGRDQWLGTEESLDDTIDDQLNVLERFLEFYTYSVLDGEGSITDIVLTGYFPNQSKLMEALNDRFPLTIHTITLPEHVTDSMAGLYDLSLKEKTKKKKPKATREKKVKKEKKQRKAINKEKGSDEQVITVREEVADDRS